MTLPDFIIAGAAKAGTTTLHNVLQRHPHIALPINELHYFDADDPATHDEFFRILNGSFQWKDPDKNDAARWHRAQFKKLDDNVIKGEDTPTYLHSFTAARRIFETIPDVKLIFALRDPVERTVSHYWHMVRTGRIVVPFEEAIIKHPQLIRWSSYYESILFYLSLFAREKISFFILEKYVGDPVSAISIITRFLGVPDFQETPQIRSNPSSYPQNPGLFRQINRIRRRLPTGRFSWHMPASDAEAPSTNWRNNSVKKLLRNRVYLKLLQNEFQPLVSEDALTFLRSHLRRRNADLQELVGEDLCSIWPSFRS